MAQKSKKQRHLDRAEIIGAYGEAIKKWPLGILVTIISIFSPILIYLNKLTLKVALTIILDCIF